MTHSVWCLVVEWPQSQLAKAIPRVGAHTLEPVLCCLDWTVTSVGHNLAVVDGFQCERLPLLHDLLVTEPQFVTVRCPPPRNRTIAGTGILRLEDERCYHIDKMRFCTIEP